MAGTGAQIDKCVACVENAFGAYKLNKRACANYAVRCAQTDDGSVTLDQDECIKQLRLIRHPELTGPEAAEKATETVSVIFVSL